MVARVPLTRAGLRLGDREVPLLAGVTRLKLSPPRAHAFARAGDLPIELLLQLNAARPRREDRSHNEKTKRWQCGSLRWGGALSRW